MINIRRIEKEEAKEVNEFLKYVWLDLYGDFLPEEVIKDMACGWVAPELSSNQLGTPNYFLAVAKNEKNEIVGLSVVAKVNDTAIKMDRLYVRSDYRRQGIGKKFLEEALTNFPGVKKIKVEVDEENYRGRAFYIKEGFKDKENKEEKLEGKVKKVVVMEKEINKKEAG